MFVGGIITHPETNADVYFDFSEVEMGIPKEGQTVQFLKEESSLGEIAKQIIILSEAARPSAKFKK